MGIKVTVVRRAHFCAAHRVYNPEWSDQKNMEVFGPCSHPNYHGHNYMLEVMVRGEVDPHTGYVVDLRLLKQLIEEEVMEPFDHKNLNIDTEEFSRLVPSTENLALVIWRRLRRRLPAHLELGVRLHETVNNYVEVWEQ